jgi:CelD/BcsL family acetyltransferase involved in cellulose biosynthesis
MNVRTVKYEHLTEEEIAAWSQIQTREPALSSPYFRPEFTEAVAAVRDDVEIGVLDNGSGAVGFFPFQRTWWGTGRPVGGIMSDFQGLIASAENGCDPIQLQQGCRLRAWHFDRVPTTQRWFARFAWRRSESPYIDLRNGFEAYVAGKDNGRRLMADYGQKVRKLAREVGPVRYVARIKDDDIFATLIAWKSDQYRRTNKRNVFWSGWTRGLLEKIRGYDSPMFAPDLSALYAGDAIAAIHFGMRSGGVLHAWFPAYNPELAKYSPGFLHWIETMKSAERLGIERIDLGKAPENGQSRFKRRLMTGAQFVFEGAVELRPGVAGARMALRSLRDRAMGSPLARPARVQVRTFRRMRHWLDAKLSH